MKRILLAAAIVAAGLSSCSKEEVVDTEINKTGNAIGFGSYATRGLPVTNNTDFQKDGAAFGVSAFITGADGQYLSAPYMGSFNEGVQIQYGTPTAGAWDYVNKADVRYWPTAGEKLSFLAYAPYGHKSIDSKHFSSVGVLGLLTLDVEVPTTEADQADIMYAIAQDVTGPSANGTQVLEFKHALTQVKFAAKTTTKGLYVDIAENGITLNNISSNGHFNTIAVESPGYSSGWMKFPGDGGVEPKTANYTVTSEAMTATYDNDDATDGLQVAKIGDDEKALMLIPQKLTAYDATTNATGTSVTVSCKIYQMVGTDKVYLKGDANTFETVTVPISSVNSAGEEIWVKAKKVTYNLLIGATLEPITFSTSVETWEDATNAGDWANE